MVEGSSRRSVVAFLPQVGQTPLVLATLRTVELKAWPRAER
jgi:hypothetical protein